MVGVTGLPVRKNNGARAQFADHASYGEFVLARGLYVGVGYVHRAAPRDFQNFCRDCGFFGANFWSASGAHFSGSEIENAGFVALLVRFEERAAAGEFDVIGMGGYGKKV